MLIFLPSCPLCCCCVASVMSDSMQPHKRQLTRFPYPWDSPGKNTGVGCHFLLQCMKVKSESEVAKSCPTLPTPWTAAHQGPPPMGFSWQQYWSGVPFPSPVLSLIPRYYLILSPWHSTLSYPCIQGLPWWLIGEESTCQSRRCGFYP